MSLIQCSECKSEISDKATTCPKCGNPISQQNDEQDIQTIQQTSKKLKLHYILSIITFIIGCFVLLIANKQMPFLIIGIMMMVGGFIWLTVAKILMWWHHR